MAPLQILPQFITLRHFNTSSHWEKIEISSGHSNIYFFITSVGFDKTIIDSGVGKKIASELIDVGADVLLPAATTGLSMALGDPTGVSGAVVGKVIGDQIQQQAEKGGYGLKDYGLKGKKLKEKLMHLIS